ncbi:protein-export chaperone SecB [Secundilactobacillus malefermentans]|uniref:Preprotein translocase subunit SecB n=1 Tax=Secundilactobacillus malefermentans TaxID=176292 RepID=A0A4R5NDD1_9LACO|nr:protein-export chaperone SecB [Secundilactobacillus malefermentans]TDG71134.1 hypothetical protein C5L31_001508 [Secundilactobacillus malefermentans]
MAVIEFKSYKVKKINFEENISFVEQEKIRLKPEFHVIVSNLEGNVSLVGLSVTLDVNSPFKLEVAIEGKFKYTVEDDKDSVGAEQLLSTNAVAILFPYLRSVVSSVTMLSNNMPTLILPTMNIIELMKKQKD